MTNVNNQVYDTLIIGGGPAGIFAAYLAKNKGLHPLLIEANDCLGGQPLMLYSQKIIHDYPGFKEIKTHVLMNNLIEQLNSANVEVLLKTTIVSYNKDKELFKVKLTSGKEVITKSIIIASGAGLFQQNKLEVPGVDPTNVEYTVRDLKEYKGKDIIVLGGGDSAVD
jgi:thioredoxin reductase (NADPH)